MPVDKNTSTIISILEFLHFAGISVVLKPLTCATFLPGLQLDNGALVIDLDKLLYPGDILHEAGHLATMPPAVRQTMTDTLENEDIHQGGEIMALCWSYAAAIHMGLDPGIVFHADGYKGEHAHILENFSQRNFIGLPLLQWAWNDLR